jgi:hypothetical protein
MNLPLWAMLGMRNVWFIFILFDCIKPPQQTATSSSALNFKNDLPHPTSKATLQFNSAPTLAQCSSSPSQDVSSHLRCHDSRFTFKPTQRVNVAYS